MQGQMENVSREMEILRKNKKKCQRLKNNNNNTAAEIKNASDGHINRLGKAEKRNSELKDISIVF